MDGARLWETGDHTTMSTPVIEGGVAGVDTLQVAQLTGDFLALAVVFFVFALLAALVGARGVAGISMEIARILIAVFIILAIVSLLL